MKVGTSECNKWSEQLHVQLVHPVRTRRLTAAIPTALMLGFLAAGCGNSESNNVPPKNMPATTSVRQPSNRPQVVSSYCSSHLASVDGFGNALHWVRNVWSDGHETNGGTC